MLVHTLEVTDSSFSGLEQPAKETTKGGDVVVETVEVDLSFNNDFEQIKQDQSSNNTGTNNDSLANGGNTDQFDKEGLKEDSSIVTTNTNYL